MVGSRMTEPLSATTTAVLLLTAPLLVSGKEASGGLLSPSEYRRLVNRLKEVGGTPADLLAPAPDELIGSCSAVIEPNRLRKLLARGFQLSQAVARWQSRAIWVASRADRAYPSRFKQKLRGASPALLYGCGPATLLDRGGLGVVGSRNVDDALLEYTQAVGRLAASAGHGVVSGGARGVDQAAMVSALDEGGHAVGVLADSLEKAALKEEYREALRDGRLALVSTHDPRTGFNVGNAMQRNKLIYALADAALVVNADLGKGGTWAGAVEQLDKFRFATIYVRGDGAPSKGLDGLRERGAHIWPNPSSPEELKALLRRTVESAPPAREESLTEPVANARGAQSQKQVPVVRERSEAWPETDPATSLYRTVRTAILRVALEPVTSAQVASALAVTKRQAEDWLRRLETEGEVERLKKPVRFVVREGSLFGDIAPPNQGGVNR